MKERGYIEQLWREEKYHVLLHSQQSYQNDKECFKNGFITSSSSTND